MTIQDFELLKSTRDAALEIEGVISSYEQKYQACQDIIKRNEKMIAGMKNKMKILEKNVEKHRKPYSKRKDEYNLTIKELNEKIAKTKKLAEEYKDSTNKALFWAFFVGVPLLFISIFGGEGVIVTGIGMLGMSIYSLGCFFGIMMSLGWLANLSSEATEKKTKISQYNSWERVALRQSKSGFEKAQSELNKQKKEISPLEKSIKEATLEMEVYVKEIRKQNEALLDIWKSVENLLP